MRKYHRKKTDRPPLPPHSSEYLTHIRVKYFLRTNLGLSEDFSRIFLGLFKDFYKLSYDFLKTSKDFLRTF